MRSRVIAVGTTTTRNRIGRVYSLWLTARAAGLDFVHVTIDDGPLWPPVKDEDAFVATINRVHDVAELEQAVRRESSRDSVTLMCKPRPELVRLGRVLADSQPVVVDIDDPELLDPWHGAGLVLRAKRVAREGPSPFRFRWAHRVVRDMTVITSNPLLQEIYGGELVPHVRTVGAEPPRRADSTGPFVIAFVGTLRDHKGGNELRAAVATLARDRDVLLRVTAPPPTDARPWEDWVGPGSLAEGITLLQGAHAVAILSRPGAWGDHQLPVKLVDAMALGVPAITTARAPMLWAAGGTSMVVRDGSSADVTDALALLADNAELATRIGAAAQARARAMFTPEVVAPGLVRAIEHAEATSPQGPGGR